MPHDRMDDGLRRQQASEPTSPAPRRSDEISDPESAYAPRRARYGDSPSHDPRAETGERHSAAAHERMAHQQPVDLDHVASRRAEATAASREDIVRDHDIERLEASLRWLRRQQVATPSPRAAAPLAAFDPASAPAAVTRNDGLPPRLSLPSSLEPVRMPPPPQRKGGNGIRRLLHCLIAGSVILPVGYYVLADHGPQSTSPAPQAISFEPASIVPQSRPGKPRQVKAQEAEERVALAESSTQAVTLPQPTPAAAAPFAPAATRDQVASVLPRAVEAASPTPAAAASAVHSPAPSLPAEEIALLLQRGEQFIASGDVVTARMVLQRAAEAGDATAAIALGATYDPMVLKKLGVMGMPADIEKARSWYERAESLGSPDARRRLDILARR